jgi:hypothetical protein
MPQDGTIRGSYKRYRNAALVCFEVLAVHCDSNNYRLCSVVFWLVRHRWGKTEHRCRVDVHTYAASERAKAAFDSAGSLVVCLSESSGCKCYKRSINLFTYVGRTVCLLERKYIFLVCILFKPRQALRAQVLLECSI